jgi:truncated hemoglobin YjbI
MSLFSDLGEDLIAKVITEFYERAFSDPIIGHFFFSKDKKHLITQQTQFVCVMLGSSVHEYLGKPLVKAHRNLIIKKSHFDRRQVIMSEALSYFNIPENICKKWLKLEEKFRTTIEKTSDNS